MAAQAAQDHKSNQNGRFICKRKRIATMAIQKVNQQKKKADKINPQQNSMIQSWQQGRRVVELGHLAEQLRECKGCHHPLHLLDVIREKRCGLSSFLYIKCRNCSKQNRVSTGKRHRQKGKKVAMQAWDANSKLGIGKLVYTWKYNLFVHMRLYNIRI